MNKISGYSLFKLSGGRELEVKFSNGAYEIFGQLLGLDTLDDIDKALQVPTKLVDDKSVPVMSLTYMRNFRLFFLAAAKYAALVQGKREIAGVALEDVNEYMAADWLEEIGYDAVLGVIPKGDTETPKKKTPLVKASQ